MYQQRPRTITIIIVALLSACSTSSPPVSVTNNTPVDARLSCTLPSNCVNSRTTSGLAPLHFAGTGAQGLALLQTTLAGFSKATVQQQDDNTITAIFTTPAGFKDDVIFVIDLQQQRIDFQSHSSFGLYDFGKNRSRMQAISARFAKTISAEVLNQTDSLPSH